MRETTALLLVKSCNFAKYSPIFNFVFTQRLSIKAFLIRSLTTRPHVKYVATLPCNLSLMACFADNSVLQGSVATYYARCAEICNRIMVMSLWPHFFGPPCTSSPVSTGVGDRFHASTPPR